MKFKIDENLPVEVAQLLRDHLDAGTVLEKGLGGQPDSAIVAVYQALKLLFRGYIRSQV